MTKVVKNSKVAEPAQKSFIERWYEVWPIIEATLPEKYKTTMLAEYIGITPIGWKPGERLGELSKRYKCAPEHVRASLRLQIKAWLDLEKNPKEITSEVLISESQMDYLKKGFLLGVIENIEQLMGAFGWLEAGIFTDDLFWLSPSVYNLQRLLGLMGFCTVCYNNLLLVGKAEEGKKSQDLINQWRAWRQKQKTVKVPMKKTVTYLPEEICERFRAESNKRKISLSQLYTDSLSVALATPPVWSFLVKGAAWQSNPLKKTWALTGIYIPLELFNRTKRQATFKKKSNMHYLACCLVWGARFWAIPEMATRYPVEVGGEVDGLFIP